MAGVELHVKDTFNYEEAAHAATEVVGNLENLPGEVSFLLEEIREKDERISLLMNRINSRHYNMTKHPARQIASSSASGTTTGSGSNVTLPIPAGTPLPVDHLTQKEATAIGKIQGEWDKIEALQEEKVKLAERMERIVGRARERARAEWVKVGGIDVDELDGEAAQSLSLSRAWELGSGEIALPPSGLGTGSDVRQKKRKPQALPLPPPSTSGSIIHPPSSMPPPPMPSRPSLSARSSNASYTQPSGRGGRHKSISTVSDADADGEGEDAEGEVDLGEGDGDDTLYCTCRQKSYGEMIGCDNDNCEFEWFHVKCVGVTPPVPDTWYCPDCVRKLGRDKKNKKR